MSPNLNIGSEAGHVEESKYLRQDTWSNHNIGCEAAHVEVRNLRWRSIHVRG